MNSGVCLFVLAVLMMPTSGLKAQEIAAPIHTRTQGLGRSPKYFRDLSDKMKAAFNNGNYGEAKDICEEALSLAEQFRIDKFYGSAIHDANMVLGRIAVVENRIDDAIQFLKKAGDTPGSPVLVSFGPNMGLAKDLIEKKQILPVFDYFEACRRFWEFGPKKLDEWTAALRKNEMPDFGANLVY